MLQRPRQRLDIFELAEEIGAGMIVVGGRGLSGVRRALMGSVSDSVVRHARCPVRVVRQGSHPESAGCRSGNEQIESVSR